MLQVLQSQKRCEVRFGDWNREQANKNIQDGISLCQTAEGALNEVQDMIHRIEELSVQAANGVNTLEDRQAIQEEINQLLSEIDRIGEHTEFNSKKIFRPDKVTTTIVENDTPIPAVRIQGFNRVNISNEKVAYMPFRGYKKNYQYQLHADEEGLWMTSRKLASMTEENVHSKISWGELGLSKWGEANDSPGDKICTYRDQYSGLEMKFTVANASDKEAVINGLNGVYIDADFDIPARLNFSGYNHDGEHIIADMYGSIQMNGSALYEIGVNFDNPYGLIDSDRPLLNSASEYRIILKNTGSGAGFTSHTTNEMVKQSVKNNSNRYINGEIGSLVTDSMTFYHHGGSTIEIFYTYDLSYFDSLTDENGIPRPATQDDIDYFASRVDANLNNWYVIQLYGDGPASVSFTAKEKGLEEGNMNNKTVTYSYDEDGQEFHIQTGSEAGQWVRLHFASMNSSLLGIGDLSVLTDEAAKLGISASQKASVEISKMRGAIGAYQNRLEHSGNIAKNTAENTRSSESRIRDLDIESELVSYYRENILMEASQAMLSHAVKNKENILNLLR